MKQLLTRLVKEDQGQDVIEYGLLAAGISIVAIPSVPTIGTWVQGKWKDIEAGLKGA
jgi:pilus assembly protein Flp/PilA